MNQRFWNLPAWLSFSLFVANCVSAAETFYVSPDGNDAWSGTKPAAAKSKQDGPFASLQHAVDVARQKGPKSVTIEVRGGLYLLTAPIVLTPADSGLRISAYQDERPIMSGGRVIGGWKIGRANGREVWEADLGESPKSKATFRELWVNAKRARRARHPNSGYLKVAEVPEKAAEWTQGNQKFRFSAGDLPAWNTLTNAEVLVMNRWVESRLPVTSVNQSDRVVSFGKRSVFQLAPGDLYFIEGALEALDEPGEWCLDRAAGKVFYLPQPGDSLQKLQVIAPSLAQVLRFEGVPEKGDFIEGVRISGLTFSHTEWCFPSGFEGGKSAPDIDPAPKAEVGGFGQAAVGVPGAVWGQGMRECVFEQCRFADLGTYGLELTRGCTKNKVVRCEFADLGAGGIKLGETRLFTSPADETGANEVTDCAIHDGGKMFASAIGIWIGQSPNNQLTHNVIHDFYYTGISIGWTWGYGPALATNNFVAFNHVHHIGVKSDGDGPILSDMGGIYTLGMQPGTRVLNNLWHDMAGVQYGGWGIYFDEGSSSIVARSNVVYNTTHGGFHQHYGATNQVENNIFAFARDQQIQRSRPESHVSFIFTTNIVYFDKGALLGSSWSDDKFNLDWNTYWDTRLASDPETLKFGDASLDQWRGRGHDQHSIISDPLFVDARKHNFALQKNSPALKLGFHPIDLSQVGPRNKP